MLPGSLSIPSYSSGYGNSGARSVNNLAIITTWHIVTTGQFYLCVAGDDIRERVTVFQGHKAGNVVSNSTLLSRKSNTGRYLAGEKILEWQPRTGRG